MAFRFGDVVQLDVAKECACLVEISLRSFYHKVDIWMTSQQKLMVNQHKIAYCQTAEDGDVDWNGHLELGVVDHTCFFQRPVHHSVVVIVANQSVNVHIIFSFKSKHSSIFQAIKFSRTIFHQARFKSTKINKQLFIFQL